MCAAIGAGGGGDRVGPALQILRQLEFRHPPLGRISLAQSRAGLAEGRFLEPPEPGRERRVRHESDCSRSPMATQQSEPARPVRPPARIVIIQTNQTILVTLRRGRNRIWATAIVAMRRFWPAALVVSAALLVVHHLFVPTGPVGDTTYLVAVWGAAVVAWVGALRRPRARSRIPGLIAAGMTASAVADLVWLIIAWNGHEPDASVRRRGVLPGLPPARCGAAEHSRRGRGQVPASTRMRSSTRSRSWS